MVGEFERIQSIAPPIRVADKTKFGQEQRRERQNRKKEEKAPAGKDSVQLHSDPLAEDEGLEIARELEPEPCRLDIST